MCKKKIFHGFMILLLMKSFYFLLHISNLTNSVNYVYAIKLKIEEKTNPNNSLVSILTMLKPNVSRLETTAHLCPEILVNVWCSTSSPKIRIKNYSIDNEMRVAKWVDGVGWIKEG